MKKLTRDERCEISALYKSGKSPSEISKQLSRSISTITRELSRNSIDGHYDFITANEAAIKRRGKHNNHSITLDNWTYVRSLIRQKWSPDQVDNWLKKHPEIGFTVSRESIYQYIKDDRNNGGDLYLSLRRSGKAYRRGRFKEYRGKIKDRIDITQRPDIINKRLRIGDWEVDSVIGCMNKSSIVTLVERVSRYTTIIKVDSKEAVGVAEAIVNRCKSNSLPVKTITGDNGLEFAAHVYIANELGIDFYFTHPYCSWEKGTNENTNGLIRQYYPKGTDFNSISQEMLDKVEKELNNRPRNCLEFDSPSEVLNDAKKITNLR
jgi:IS30 family transposase